MHCCSQLAAMQVDKRVINYNIKTELFTDYTLHYNMKNTIKNTESSFDPLSPSIHIQILQTDLPTFP